MQSIPEHKFHRDEVWFSWLDADITLKTSPDIFADLNTLYTVTYSSTKNRLIVQILKEYKALVVRKNSRSKINCILYKNQHMPNIINMSFAVCGQRCLFYTACKCVDIG